MIDHASKMRWKEPLAYKTAQTVLKMVRNVSPSSAILRAADRQRHGVRQPAAEGRVPTVGARA
jgi:hypothetical protein